MILCEGSFVSCAVVTEMTWPRTAAISSRALRRFLCLLLQSAGSLRAPELVFTMGTGNAMTSFPLKQIWSHSCTSLRRCTSSQRDVSLRKRSRGTCGASAASAHARARAARLPLALVRLRRSRRAWRAAHGARLPLALVRLRKQSRRALAACALAAFDLLRMRPRPRLRKRRARNARREC